MKNFTLFGTVSLLLIFSKNVSAQAPDLGTAAQFVLFTTVGAVGSTGLPDITGDVGSDDGAITGFEAITGTVYNADAVTAQAALDVMAAYTDLFNRPATSTTHTPAFGSGETLFPGVYSIAGAASVVSSLTLDAQGDANALFIFKTGGALTTAASTTIYLTNGAAAYNVFWIAEGAISMAASTRSREPLFRIMAQLIWVMVPYWTEGCCPQPVRFQCTERVHSFLYQSYFRLL